ncbi:NAD-dependent epimerase/dehydratase family protein [Pseudomonas sp. SDO5532_S415]
MNIAILGANSHIAKDLVSSFADSTGYQCHLFVRNLAALSPDVRKIAERKCFPVLDYSSFSLDGGFDAIINFVGVGDPARAKIMGSQIFEVTEQYDQLALAYIKKHPHCKYIFLSSGAAYGTNFEEPVGECSKATFPINDLQSQDWYSIAKFYAECRHRALSDFSIIDLRVFGYFSHRQSPDARFFLSDILRALKAGDVLGVSPENMVRDYLSPVDFFQLIEKLLTADPVNDSVDCYTLDPIDKFSLLARIKEKFGLQYDVIGDSAKLNATGSKSNYYSLNRAAEKYGYLPRESSLSGILSEIDLYLEGVSDREVRL